MYENIIINLAHKFQIELNWMKKYYQPYCKLQVNKAFPKILFQKKEKFVWKRIFEFSHSVTNIFVLILLITRIGTTNEDPVYKANCATISAKKHKLST